MSWFFSSPLEAQILYDLSLIIVVTFASFFILPLSALIVVQGKNFLSGMTTRNRHEAEKHNFNPAIVPITGKEYAQ